MSLFMYSFVPRLNLYIDVCTCFALFYTFTSGRLCTYRAMCFFSFVSCVHQKMLLMLAYSRTIRKKRMNNNKKPKRKKDHSEKLPATIVKYSVELRVMPIFPMYMHTVQIWSIPFGCYFFPLYLFAFYMCIYALGYTYSAMPAYIHTQKSK